MFPKTILYSVGLIIIAFTWILVLGERLAARKCAEYRKMVAQKRKVIPLLIDPTPLEFDVYKCANEVKLIVGGVQAEYGEFPHHALLGYPKRDNPSGYNFLCGGTLISEQHVLTAAHCFGDIDPVVVRLGEYDTSQVSGDEMEIEIDRVRRHPSYPRGQPYHDIALVRLKYPVTLTKLIRPACLWDSDVRNTTKFIATGFGGRDFAVEQLSTTMMKVELDEFPADDCSEAYKSDRRFRNGLRDGQLCVGSIVGGRDTCQGDSGGPLQVLTNAKTCTYAVVGITSTGGACGINHSKAIYTKVSHYIDWIEDNVWGRNAL